MWRRSYMVISFLVLLKAVYLNGQDKDDNESLTLLEDKTNLTALTTNEVIKNIPSTTKHKLKAAKAHAATTGSNYKDITFVNGVVPYLTDELELIEIKGDTQNDSIFLSETSVITCDGYILSLFRVNGTVNGTDKYPVLMFHGILQSSDVFTEGGKNSIAFILQDLGYDVWLGNNRGNKYSRSHIYLEPDMSGEKYKFFNYTYEEIGLYDVAANVDYILKETGKTKLHYIGHGQGGTAFLVLNSLQPQYNLMFESAHLLAPLGYQSHTSAKIKALSDKSAAVYNGLLSSGIVEIFPYNPKLSNENESPSRCLGDDIYEEICNDLDIAGIMGLDHTKFNPIRGGAIKQLEHYAQNIRDEAFRRYDHGAERNKISYGTNEPPEYNLKFVTTRTVLHYSVHDKFVAGKDVVAMAKAMPNGTAVEVPSSTFSHSDFTNGNDLIPYVYNRVVRDMSNENDDLEDWIDEEVYQTDSSNKLGLSLILYALPLLTLLLT